MLQTDLDLALGQGQRQAQHMAKLADVPWRPDVEVVRGDLTDPDTLQRACDGVDVVYHLVHAMGTAADFADAERRGAVAMADAVRSNDVSRIVYLGGLHPEGSQLSRHLRSRTEVGRILCGSGATTMVLQAGVVVGAVVAESVGAISNRTAKVQA